MRIDVWNYGREKEVGKMKSELRRPSGIHKLSHHSGCVITPCIT